MEPPRPASRDRCRPRHRPRWVVSVVGLALVVTAGVGCGGDGATSEACGPVQREPLDPRSVHVLPGADAPTYRTEPPTSGPHLPSPATEAVRDEPIAAPIQVGILEEGGVVIQHVGLSTDDRERVEGLGGDGVVVAPAAELPDGAEVVATAWVTKQTCEVLDVEALRTFVADNEGNGPGDHG